MYFINDRVLLSLLSMSQIYIGCCTSKNYIEKFKLLEIFSNFLRGRTVIHEKFLWFPKLVILRASVFSEFFEDLK